ncbi:MAG: enolase C-terminal domain-like protein [Chloroflexota bacterium]
MSVIAGIEVHDVRFPTSRGLHGSDAMNAAPDYAASYLELRVSDGRTGQALVFTLGDGNAVQVGAVRVVAEALIGADVDALLDDLGGTSRSLVSRSEFRWLGPEKGVIHMAVGACVNALFDLASKRRGLPLWEYLALLPPEEVVALVDFRYLSDALTAPEALKMLRAGAIGREARIAEMRTSGYPAYTTSAGWLGYSDQTVMRLCRKAVDDGFDFLKLKVGSSAESDRRRCRLVRDLVGPDVAVAVDANQVWDVEESIIRIHELSEYGLAWVEEPTSPDDILGLRTIREAVRPVPIACGEHVANRVIWKQLFQASAVDVAQIDACRVGGVPEEIAILLLAAKCGVPVCPHAGGVGLCEIVQHLSFFDYASVSGTVEGRRIEWIDHLHEHFVSPAAVRAGRYEPPSAPGSSAAMLPSSLREFSFGGRGPG